MGNSISRARRYHAAIDDVIARLAREPIELEAD
jgi:hypothetical protein